MIAFTTVLVALWYIHAFIQPPPTSHIVWFLSCALVGSLFPDVDIKSKGQLVFYRMACCGVIVSIYWGHWMALSALSCGMLVPLLVKHRGITHQVWFVLCAPFVVPCITALYAPQHLTTAFFSYLFFVGGAMSHLMLDFGLSGVARRGLFGRPVRRSRNKRKQPRYVYQRTK